MAKKKDYKPKGPIQILAAIGLVIAILWTAKGLFQAGTAGYKEVTNKVSSGSGLPVLKCVSDDNGKDYIDIIDLQKIKSEQGSFDSIKTKIKKRNVTITWMQTSDEDYFISYVNNVNGIKKGYVATIMRDTGVIEYRFPPNIAVTATIGESIEAMGKAEVYKGVCEKIKRKKL
jgi:aspartokinase